MGERWTHGKRSICEAHLGAIYTDFFSLSMNDVVLAMAPPEERATGWKDRFPQDIPTVHQFQRAFNQAQYRPVPEN
jgi:hypothetical protein